MFNLIKRQKAGTTQALSTSAALVLAADNNRGRVVIQNTHGSIAVFIGNADVSATNGVKIVAGESQAFFTRGKLYAIAASGTPSIAILPETTRGNDVKTMVTTNPAVGDTATRVLPRDNKRQRAILHNTGSAAITIGNGSITAGSGGITLAQHKTLTLHGTEPIYASGPGTNEIQTLTKNGSPTGGDYKLTFNGQETSAIAHNASAADMQTALRALSSIGSTGCSVSGTTPYTVTFTGALANTNVPLITLSNNGLTGGTSPTIAVAESTAGASGSYTGLLVTAEKA